VSCKRTSRQERTWQKDRRRGLSVVTVSPFRRSLTRIPSTDTDHLCDPFFVAASRQPCPDSCAPYATHAKGPRSNEYSTALCDQRYHWRDRPRDYRCDSRW